MLPLSEDQLVQRLQARDTTAMTFFYDKYGPTLGSIIRRIVRQEALAEDVLQECLVKIWHNIHTYDATKGRLFTWALTICRHAAIDQLRTRQQQQVRSTQVLEDSVAWHQAALVTFKPEHIAVRELLTLLRPSEERLLELVYFEGFTHGEIALAMQLPLGTVKTRVRTALRLLAKLVQ